MFDTIAKNENSYLKSTDRLNLLATFHFDRNKCLQVMIYYLLTK